NYFLTSAELGELIGMMQDYDDNDEAAQKWIQENQSKIETWMS
ncbi:MAG: glycine/betaine ABC transporter, partial [Ruminococcaceae bacterium]|nr:glycine/betaine ABC transporter [Oscillospiraceae bacterium]